LAIFATFTHSGLTERSRITRVPHQYRAIAPVREETGVAREEIPEDIPMDAEKKATVLNGMMRRMAAGGADIQTADWLEFVAAQNDGALTGPPIGAKVPPFSLPDQHGGMRALADLSGPNGLLLVFSRSADW
jgi:hypothetical protein